jgi:hypothetical protein
MYIIVQVAAALGAPLDSHDARPMHLSIHPTVHITSNTTCIATCLALAAPFSAITLASFAFFLHKLQLLPSPTPHGLCFNALALALRIRASCH